MKKTVKKTRWGQLRRRVGLGHAYSPAGELRDPASQPSCSGLATGPHPRLTLPFQLNAFHLWSKKRAAIFGIPNGKGFFTCTLTLPLTGPESFETITTRKRLCTFFKEHFPDLRPFVPALANDFLKQPATPFTSLYTSKWHYKDFALLMGDAAHAVTIFYGQGINAAFEDCRILSSCIDEFFPDFEKVFSAFQARRKPDTDVLADLCKKRFIDLKDRYESPYFVAKSTVEALLEKRYPSTFHSLYSLIVHTTLSYSAALQRYTKEKRAARLLGMDFLVLWYSLMFVFRSVSSHFVGQESIAE